MSIYFLFISSIWIADIGNGSELISWSNPHHDIVMLRYADGTTATVEACKYESAICECGNTKSWETSIKNRIESAMNEYYDELKK